MLDASPLYELQYDKLFVVTLVLDGKKIAGAEFMISDIFGIGGTISCEIEYGKAEVSLPDEFVDETQGSQGMDEKEWIAAFDESNFENLTAVCSQTAPNQKVESTYVCYTQEGQRLLHSIDKTFSEEDEGTPFESYYDFLNDGFAFRYSKGESGWERYFQETAFHTMYEEILPVVLMFRDMSEIRTSIDYTITEITLPAVTE